MQIDYLTRISNRGLTRFKSLKRPNDNLGKALLSSKPSVTEAKEILKNEDVIIRAIRLIKKYH